MRAGGSDELARLRAENMQLVELSEAEQLADAPLATHEKIALSRRLLQGRSNVPLMHRERKMGKRS